MKPMNFPKFGVNRPFPILASFSFQMKGMDKPWEIRKRASIIEFSETAERPSILFVAEKFCIRQLTIPNL